MFKYALLLSALMTVTPVFAQETTENKTQADYDREVGDAFKTLTENLQNTSIEVIKYMNALNKALSESVPQLSQNVSQLVSSVRPIAETMQKNVDDFASEMDKQISDFEGISSEETDNYPEPPQANISQVNEPQENTLFAQIDAEIKRIQEQPVPPVSEPVKIKLFPSTVE